MSLAIISFASIFIHSNGFELNQAEAQVQSSFWLMLPILSPGFEPFEPVQAPATAATKKRLFLFSSEQTQMALLSIFLVTSRHVGLQKETQPGKKASECESENKRFRKCICSAWPPVYF